MPHIFGYDLPEEQAVAAVLEVFRARGAVEALLALKDEGLIDPAAQREMGIVNAAPFCGGILTAERSQSGTPDDQRQPSRPHAAADSAGVLLS